MSLELAVYIIVLAGAAAITVLVTLYLTKFRKTREKESAPSLQNADPVERWRQRTQKSVTPESVKGAENELRTLDLEKEILSHAIRRLYEARAEGEITEEEMERLSERYKSRMRKVNEAISEDQSIVALHELEAMKEDLTKLFDEKFDEISGKIEELRSKVGIEMEEAIIPTPITMPPQMEEAFPTDRGTTRKTKKKALRKPQKSRKTAAEERLEKIRSEVEKVLNRLEQMEAEA